VAEFLVYAKTHWMDAPNEYERQMLLIDAKPSLTVEQKLEAKDAFTRKYNARYQPGDIVEVREDGFWGEPNERDKHGWNHKAFALVKVPRLTVDERYMAALEDTSDPEQRVLLKHRKYTVAALGLKPGETRVIDRLADARIEAKSG